MIIKEFIERCSALNKKSSVYSDMEIKALAHRALQDIYEIPEHRILTEPYLQIPSSAKFTTTEETCISESPLSDEYEQKKIIRRIVSGEPIQYIVGYERFCGNKYKVGPGVLIPRPETEQLVKLILKNIEQLPRDVKESDKKFRIIDLCTGSGCIAWELWRALDYNSLEVYGCDISEAALHYAKHQQVKNCSPIFFLCDILSENATDIILEKTSGDKFDILVSNPPYIAHKERVDMHINVKEFEPAEALFVPDEDPQKFYKSIVRIAEKTVKPNGKLFLECNNLYIKETANLLEMSGFKSIEVVRDFSDVNRFLSATLIVPPGELSKT